MATHTASNTVVLEGRIGSIEWRSMPSGDEALVFRVVVDRAPKDRGPSGRVAVDALDCVAWRTDVQRRIERFSDGAWVRVEGALRRRFWRTPGGTASRIEVEARRVTAVG